MKNRRQSTRSWATRMKRLLASAGLVLVAALAFHLRGPAELAHLQVLAGTLATVAGTLFGLVLASASVLISVQERTLVANMRITGHYRVLCRHMLIVASLWCAVMVISLASMLGDASIFRVATSLAVGLALLAALGMAWLLRRLHTVLTHLG